jgi:hypothetical protein
MSRLRREGGLRPAVDSAGSIMFFKTERRGSGFPSTVRWDTCILGIRSQNRAETATDGRWARFVCKGDDAISLMHALRIR